MNYIDIDNFKNMFTCISLLNIEIKLKKLSLNLINGRTGFVMLNGQLDNTICNIDKGSNFMFVKVKVKGLNIDDLTGYPNTNR
jgi:hypothetical protein